MRKVFGFLLIVAALWALKEGHDYWRSFKAKDRDANRRETGATPTESGDNLPGLPPALEPYLQAAIKQGSKTFKTWLNYYGPQIQDPRRAWIELDYVTMVSGEDTSEARRVYAAVKARTPKTSPVYPRIKRLESAYE
jgi:hypothetical protein